MGVARSRRGEMAWALLSPIILILGLTLAVVSVEWPHRFGKGLDVPDLVGLLALSVVGLACGVGCLRNCRSPGAQAVAGFGIFGNAVVESFAAIFLVLRSLPWF